MAGNDGGADGKQVAELSRDLETASDSMMTFRCLCIFIRAKKTQYQKLLEAIRYRGGNGRSFIQKYHRGVWIMMRSGLSDFG